VSPEVFFVVLGVAVAHAAWNALLRAEPNKNGMLKVMFVTQTVMALAVLPFVALPSLESIPYLTVSAVIGVGAMLLLSHAYRFGDLSQVYPLSRGSSPLIVALVSIALLGEVLTLASMAGIALIALGVISLSVTRNIRSLRNGPLVAIALANGATSAMCNMIDGYGARLSGSTHGYVAMLALVLSVLMVLTTQVMQRGASTPLTARTIWLGAVAGLMSLGAAWAAIWAMTLAPIPLVSALREASIVFATIIGLVFFREALTLQRVLSIALVVFGVVVLRLNG